MASLAGEIAAAARARHVVRVHVRAGFDVVRGRADRAAVLDHRFARGDPRQRDLVAAGNRLAHRRSSGPSTSIVCARRQRVERRRDVVARADDDDP